MNSVLFPIFLVSGIGLLIGLVLSIASIVFKSDKDDKLEPVLEILPGLNCGACGFSGCKGYAEALIENKANTNLCIPGKERVANKLSEFFNK